MNVTERSEFRRPVLRLTLQFTGLIVIVLVVVGIVVFAGVAQGVAEGESRSLFKATQVDSPRDLPPGVWMMGDDDDGGNDGSRDLPAGLPDVAAVDAVSASGSAHRSEVSEGGREFSILTTVKDGRVLQVALDRHEGQEELGRTAAALVLGGFVAVVLSAFAAWWMARRSIRPLAEALALQRRFVADASHELRTPLTLLSTRAQILRRRYAREPVDEEALAGVDELVRDSNELTGILEDLLISADPREVETPESVDVARAADEAVAALHSDAARRGIIVSRDGSTVPVLVSGSRARIRRMLVAMMSNAADHARSTVTVTVAVVGRLVELRVQDDGPGFPPELVGRAFERFASARVASPSSSTGSGDAQRHYGLGLALVADVAARLGGSVSIRPSDGGGALIVVAVPRAKA